MKIIKQYPPNIDEIRKHFNLAGKKPCFTYGYIIYSPFNDKLPDHIIKHEETHAYQQDQELGGAVAWWIRYLGDKEFRLQQELEAYRAQWRFIQDNMNREGQRKWLKRIASDLSSSMYGSIISSNQAKELIDWQNESSI